MIAFRVARKSPLLDFFFVPAQGLERVRFQMRVGLHEFWDEGIEETEEIVEHKNLAVTMRPSPNPDGGDRQRLGDPSGKLGRDRLQHKSKCSSRFKRSCIVQQFGGLILHLPLNFIPTELMKGLGCHAQMAHDGNP